MLIATAPRPAQPPRFEPQGAESRRSRRCGAARLRRCAVALALAAGVVAFVIAIDPRSLGAAFARVAPAPVLAALALGAAFYALQGLRWHQLLRATGARPRLRDSELINLAGQVASEVIPVGDLTRAWLASRSAGVPMRSAAATVTVQELGFALLLVLTALPGLLGLPGGVVWLVAALAGIGAVVVILTVRPLFRASWGAVTRIPGARRLLTPIEGIDVEVRQLLRRPDVGLGAGIDLGRVIAAVTSLWLILRALQVTGVGWWQAALVVAVAYVGGAVSLVPGGVGINEAGVVGALVVLGVDPAHAAAAAVLQRLWLGTPALVGGAVAALILRRRGSASARRSRAPLHPGGTPHHAPTPAPWVPVTSASTSRAAVPLRRPAIGVAPAPLVLRPVPAVRPVTGPGAGSAWSVAGSEALHRLPAALVTIGADRGRAGTAHPPSEERR